jgi:hypothetical protein
MYSFPHKGSLRGHEVFNKAELPQSINISFDPKKLSQDYTRVKISNKIRSAFDRPNANQLMSRVG